MKRKSVGALLPLLHRQRPLGTAQKRAIAAFTKQANKAFRKSKSQRKAERERWKL